MADRIDRIATLASAAEVEGFRWALAQGLAAPLTQAEAQALARRAAEIARAAAR